MRSSASTRCSGSASSRWSHATIAASYAAVRANASSASARRVSSLERALLAQLGEHVVVLRGIGDDRDPGVVLRRRARHRRAADVDGLDVGRLAERVEVAHHHVERRDVVLLEVGEVRRLAAVGEDAAVHLRVQRDHAVVEHVGEPGERRGGAPRGCRPRRSRARCSTSRRAPQPRSCSPRAKSTSPALSHTESSARIRRRSSASDRRTSG